MVVTQWVMVDGFADEGAARDFLRTEIRYLKSSDFAVYLQLESPAPAPAYLATGGLPASGSPARLVFEFRDRFAVERWVGGLRACYARLRWRVDASWPGAAATTTGVTTAAAAIASVAEVLYESY